MTDESKIRKRIWERRDAVDAKMAEPGFEALAMEEQDAWVVSLMLALPLDQVRRCIRGKADGDDLPRLWQAQDEVFKYGKRSALRVRKAALARQGSLKRDEPEEIAPPSP